MTYVVMSKKEVDAAVKSIEKMLIVFSPTQQTELLQKLLDQSRIMQKEGEGLEMVTKVSQTRDSDVLEKDESTTGRPMAFSYLSERYKEINFTNVSAAIDKSKQEQKRHSKI